MASKSRNTKPEAGLLAELCTHQDGEVCDDEWVDPAEVGEPSGGDAAERVGDADDRDEEVGVLDGDAVQRCL